MMVTFVSQCEKKALAKTRRVLDSFANRIGDRTWQTVITAEGLLAVRKLLRKTASKSTAVSCHQLKSRSRSELLWIIGNRRKFNTQGIVPVSRTGRDILHRSWEDDWHTLPLIKSLVALAGLFHDWGKASELFQAKLNPARDDTPKGDPLRHEWISGLFLSALVNGETDEQWLGRLAQGQMDPQVLMDAARVQSKRPLSELPDAAGLVGWLVLTHHRLPVDREQVNDQLGLCVETPADLLKKITQQWGYENRYEEAEFERHVQRCFDYPHGLPDASKIWMKEMRRYAIKMLALLPQLNSALADGSWRLVLQHARLCLMLGDHFYSSLDFLDARRVKGGELELYANTGIVDGEPRLKQLLDEHLVGVAKQAVRNAHMLPLFEANEDELQFARDKKVLQRKSPAPFTWQDRIVGKIKVWRASQGKAINTQQFGFFTVNMASTGKGKTFANAKIMRALSADSKSLRYILALGLRTLTLQTGDEYRQRIGLWQSSAIQMPGPALLLRLALRLRTVICEPAMRNMRLMYLAMRQRLMFMPFCH